MPVRSCIACLLPLAAMVISTGLASANSMRSSPRSNALGNADSFGYVRVVQDLGDFDIGNGRQWPLYMVFTTNPGYDPGAFGPGWKFPLFASYVVQYNNYSLVWEAPDERRYFFARSDAIQVRRGEEAYLHQGRRWQAVVSRNGDILITGTKTPQWAFEYRGGRLVRFRPGPDSDTFRIEYNGRGHPRRVTAENSRRVIFEMEYQGAAPRRMHVADKRFDLELGAGEMMSPDGKTDYAHYRMPFLRALSEDESRTEFHYVRTGFRQRDVYVERAEGRGRDKTSVRVPVNRMVVRRPNGSQSQVEWEATSGFITADSGGRYEVENHSYDPHGRNPEAEVPRRVTISPQKVALKRVDEEGREQLWSRDWPSGVNIYTDPSTGELVRRTIIMAGGPAYGKVRKVEVRKPHEGEWSIESLLAYNSNGSLVRRIDGHGMVSHYVYATLQDGKQSIERYGSQGAKEMYLYNKYNVLIEKKIYINYSEFKYAYDDDGRLIKLYRDGNLIKEIHRNKDEILDVLIYRNAGNVVSHCPESIIKNKQHENK